ncbi:MAG: 23S rRNA (cytidine1920-2'-O)/16S rRNA (cytidine1409-2'-O)-methyltransferase [Paracoccaceae bacterium]|jgi:23S rRNA (cytidine1920-2'-O)/16S rRNA (cytidine1409-2'-O)-methyltransferase
MRIDQRLLALGLVDSRARAQALIAAGVVRVNGAVATKSSRKTAETDAIEVTDNPCPWVSRAALKLVHALDSFGLTPHGEALDVGASTGGFTEVLLARGASRVHALDVGHGQLHSSLQADPRVRSLEGINARAIPPGLVPPVDWIVSDVSFIGLEKALPGPMALARPGARLVALIKPQFEAGPGAVGKDGVLKNPEMTAMIRAKIAAFVTESGWIVTHEGESPITGGDGNHEYLIAARLPEADPDADPDAPHARPAQARPAGETS